MSSKKSMPKDGRTRNWTFIVYPDSAPNNWQSIIDGENLQWIESPLHVGEVNPDGENEKKSHWHVLLLFEGKKSYEQVREITDRLNGTVPQICNSAKGLVRYMAHLDHPDKKKYNTSDIVGHGGIDVTTYLKPLSSERYKLIAEMIDFVQDRGLTEIEDLLVYAKSERFDDWFSLLCDNSAYIMGALLKSRRNRMLQEQSKPQRHLDRETGEIVE